MRRHFLAIIGAIALAAPLIATGTAQAADAPGQPGIPTAIPGFQRGEVLLNWSPPDPADGILGYEVQYSSDNGGSWSDPINTASSRNSFTVAGLDVRKYYVFQVAAFTGRTPNDPADEFLGPWSRSSAPTQPAQSVGPPSYIVTTSGNASAVLDWEEPTPGALQYQVQYGPSATGPWPTDSLTTSVDHIEVGGLTPGKTYYFRVRSFNSDTDKSDWVVAPNPAVPTGGTGSPTNVRALAGIASATVSWTASSTPGSSYEIQYRTDNGTWSSPISSPTTTVNVGGLTNGTRYTFQVRAISGGVGSTWVASNPVTPVAAQVPAAPTTVSAHGIDSAAVIAWTMPANQPVTTYLIQYSINNSQWSPATPVSTGRVDQTFVLGGLTNGQSYYIRVAAANGTLSSPWTQMPGTVRPAGVPGPPQLVTGAAGNSQVTLTWQAPVNVSATSPVTGYRVQYSSNGGATWMSAPDVTAPITTTTVSGLANGTGYVFRVRATSYAGDGAWSATTGVVTPPGGPGAPTNVTAVAGDSRATVTWTASSTSGAAIIGYRVTSSPGGQTCTTSAVPPTAPSTSCTVIGLANGQAYTFTVVAVTTSGSSAPSSPSAAVTPSGQTVSIRITNSGRNGNQVFARGTTTGLTSGTTVAVLVRNKAGASFRPAGQVTVQDDGSVSWSTKSGKKTWVRFVSGGVTSNTVIVSAK